MEKFILKIQTHWGSIENIKKSFFCRIDVVPFFDSTLKFCHRRFPSNENETRKEKCKTKEISLNNTWIIHIPGKDLYPLT